MNEQSKSASVRKDKTDRKSIFGIIGWHCKSAPLFVKHQIAIQWKMEPFKKKKKINKRIFVHLSNIILFSRIAINCPIILLVLNKDPDF